MIGQRWTWEFRWVSLGRHRLRSALCRAGVVALAALVHLEAVASPLNFMQISEFRRALDGLWDEGAYTAALCTGAGNLRRLYLSDDGQWVTWHLEKPQKTHRGDEVTEYRYRVLGATSVSLTLALAGETRKNRQGELFVWELVIVDTGHMRWRSTDFPVGVYNNVVLRRCRM
ncbi:MAG TPA: hypothetical protein VM491_12915 [Burkholderiaceae bacterium]|jgi:hypothetical protein|nr:hypothetical protein [Burkholderiaceae bacterium]